MNKFFVLCSIIMLSAYNVAAQQLNLPLNRDIYQEYDGYLNRLEVTNFHSSVKPYKMSDIYKSIKVDTLDICYSSFKANDDFSWFHRKVGYEHLIAIDSADYQLHIDPLFDLQVGKDTKDTTRLLHVNTRGVLFEGNLGKNVSFGATYLETQAVFPAYIAAFVNDSNNKIVPGQGRVKDFTGLGRGFDFGVATGYISYKASKYFAFTFGTDRNFIGEGYRSLFLSDNAFPYPFLKITTNVWKFQYTNIYAALLDLRNSPIAQQAEATNQYFSRKYMTTHYLSYNISKRVNIGLFESIIFADTVNHGGFRVDYLNPIIFYRPVEYSLGSPNNALLGGALNIKVTDNIKFYSQVILDEFVLNEVKAFSHGWSGNKQGLQVGVKGGNLFGIAKLRAQYEFNWVRPYTYSHEFHLQNYAHYNQSLADPLGANFFENIAMVNYRSGRWFVEAKFNFAVYGADSAGINYGGNIFQSYTDPSVRTYGNNTAQGVFNTLMYKEFRVSYLVNPSFNLNIEAGISSRSLVSDAKSSMTNWIYFGIRTSLSNHVYDF